MAAYLARFKGQSRVHAESDLRNFVTWCRARNLDPLAATRPHLELYIRWLQEIGNYKPSTVSRRLSIVSGFYRTCVVDGVLEHSPAEYVRRPRVPAESPTLGLTHLQFEGMLSAARESANKFDFALVSMLGLLGLRIFEATGSDIENLESHTATESSGSTARGTKSSWCPSRLPCHAPSTELWRTACPGPSC